MTDQQHGGAAGPERVEQLEDLGLDGHIQGGGRLVRDEQRRRQGDRRGDEGALAQPAGELAGALPGSEGRIRDAGVGEQLEHTGASSGRSELGVQAQRVVDLPPDGAQRVQGDQRILQDKTDLLPADAAPSPRRKGQQRLIAQRNRVGFDVGAVPVRPIRVRAVTLLPEPDSPTSARHSPAPMLNDTFLTTAGASRPKRTERSLTRSSGALTSCASGTGKRGRARLPRRR